jgi:DNA-binding MarR family transcriptional regulator
LLIHDSEIAAARTLLLLLANSGGEADDSTEVRASALATDPSPIRDRAEQAFALRQRRMELFERFEGSFGTEPPFALLLTLYVHEEREPDISVRLLAKLAWLAYTTVVRWVDELESKGLIQRQAHPSDGRAGRVQLTKKARSALENLFSGAD